MKSLRDELAKVVALKSEAATAEAFLKFCAKHKAALPLPGEDSDFDRALWAASEFSTGSLKDAKLLKKVVDRLLNEAPAMAAPMLKLKELVGHGKEAAISAWQEMLASMAWQQMVPAGATRGVGAQMVSLGTFAKDVGDANVQINLGWLVDKDQLRILMQAKDSKDEALSDVELRIKEADDGVVLSRVTNEDGTVVAPNVKVLPGRYRIEVVRGKSSAETPYFEV